MEIADLIIAFSVILGGVAVLVFAGCIITNNIDND